MSQFNKSIVPLLFVGLLEVLAIGQISKPGSYEKLRQDTVFQVKSKVNPLLARYCKDACQIVRVDVDIEESVADTEDLGFEGVAGDDLGSNLYVAKVGVEVQIDDRVTNVNRDRLRTILKNNLQDIGLAIQIIWRPVTLPQIGQSAAKEEKLKRGLRRRISASLDAVINDYCPEACVLSEVAIDGKLITLDEAAGVPPKEVVRDQDGQAILKVENIDIEVAMDEGLSEEARKRIMNIMRAKTRFASPIDYDFQVTAFPESYARKKARLSKESADPFGLEKLRQTLKIFRELAGTKEIIRSSTNNSQSTNSRSETSKEESQTRQSSSNQSSLSSEANNQPFDWTWMLIFGLIGLVLIIAAAIFMRWKRDSDLMMHAAQNGTHAPAGKGAAGSATGEALSNIKVEGGSIDDEARAHLGLRVKCAELREELIKIFLDAPKVAKETFSRLLQEEGVEEAAKYVHIFGHMVVFELLDDPNLQRDLFELSEYYHKSDFEFEPKEELSLLQALRTRVTANEIRVLTRKQLDKFDFLVKLDSTQIYNLIAEEKAQVQSIVLTQLDHKRRRGVFDMYKGQAKVHLMRELCKADAIPKEYLSNVAKALQKKVSSRPEFDTENLRSSDILLDLLEKANLEEQRSLMQNLMSTNAEAARGIKIKLVTVEMLPYLKDGHLLEIILGMERDDLLTFLSGTREHIRNLLLSKAPGELAESWFEDLQAIASIDEQNYRLMEMKILGRIRSLANSGTINLLDINNMIFGTGEESGDAEEDGEQMRLDSDAGMVA